MKQKVFKITKLGTNMSLSPKYFSTKARAFNYGAKKFGMKKFQVKGGWTIRTIIKNINQSSKSSKVRSPKSKGAKFSMYGVYKKLARRGNSGEGA